MQRKIEALLVEALGDPRRIANCHKRRGVRMGKNCQVLQNVSFGSEPYLVQLGENVKITGGVNFVTHDGGAHVLRALPGLQDVDYVAPIVIGNNVFIGIKSVILPGITIGDNVVIGAGSVVARDIPAGTVAAGVPAKVVSSLEEYKAKIVRHGQATKNMNGAQKRRFFENSFWATPLADLPQAKRNAHQPADSTPE